MIWVGDYFQHTFDTSRDGPVRKNLHKDFDRYRNEYLKLGFTIDDDSLKSSFRCSPSICSFISENLGIDIQSHRSDETSIQYLTEQKEIENIVEDNDITKLFFQNSRKYRLNSKNWGESKGEDHHQNVCVVLNDTTLKKYEEESLDELPQQTINKLYVAITRARGNVFFVQEKTIKKYKCS
jgi:hypothetical protein